MKRWTKGIDVFAHDILFVPIHDIAHWSLVIVWNIQKAAAAYRQAWLQQQGGCLEVAAALPGASRATAAVLTENSLLPVSIMYLDSFSSDLSGVEYCRTLHR